MPTTKRTSRESTSSSAPVLSLYSQESAIPMVMKTIISSPRLPLADIRPDERPGVYVLFARTPSATLSRYGDTIASGRFPIYVGSAQMLPKRISRHRQTIASASGLSVSDFAACVVYTDSLAAALAVEQILITTIRPPWNERSMSGFGSDPKQVAHRTSGFDCLHHRPWATVPSAKQRSNTRAALRPYLQSGYVRNLWPTLKLTTKRV